MGYLVSSKHVLCDFTHHWSSHSFTADATLTVGKLTFISS